MAGQGGAPLDPRQGRGGRNRPEGRSTSAMAVASLVMGVITLIFSFIPIINNAAFVLGVIGLVFALVGLHATGRKGYKKGKGLSVAGVVLCVLAMVITLAMQSGFSKAADSVSGSAGAAASQEKPGGGSAKAGAQAGSPASGGKSKTETITLKATSTGSGSVTYGPAGSSSQEKFTGDWQKDITGDAAKQTHTMTVMGEVMNQDPSQKVTCDVLVNGVSKDHKEATGSAAAVTCTSPIF